MFLIFILNVVPTFAYVQLSYFNKIFVASHKKNGSYIWFWQVRIMRKRLVRKAFDMILGISLSENRDVSSFILCACHWKIDCANLNLLMTVYEP